ncbi:TPA: hypothetical protein LA827_003401 [Clostridium botulinum]|nr:hypothetical protein [Clostridium botulinum]
MELAEPKFMSSEYVYYDDEGLKIKEYSPQWVKDEYGEFMKELNSNEMAE